MRRQSSLSKSSRLLYAPVKKPGTPSVEGPLPVHGGSLTASKRAVSNDCDAEFATNVKDAVGPYVWGPWRELDLQRINLGDFVRPADLFFCRLTNPEILDFAFLLQSLQFPPRFFYGDGSIDLCVQYISTHVTGGRDPRLARCW